MYPLLLGRRHAQLNIRPILVAIAFVAVAAAAAAVVAAAAAYAADAAAAGGGVVAVLLVVGRCLRFSPPQSLFSSF